MIKGGAFTNKGKGTDTAAQGGGKRPPRGRNRESRIINSMEKAKCKCNANAMQMHEATENEN